MPVYQATGGDMTIQIGDTSVCLHSFNDGSVKVGDSSGRRWRVDKRVDDYGVSGGNIIRVEGHDVLYYEDEDGLPIVKCLYCELTAEPAISLLYKIGEYKYEKECDI